MLRLTSVRIVAAFAALAVAANCSRAMAVDEGDPKAELQGRWKMLTSNDNEIRGDRDMPNTVILTIDGDKFNLDITNEGGSRSLAGGYSLDPTQTPRLIDFMVRADDATATLFAIYRISGDRLTIRWRTDDSRPGDFTSPQVEFDATHVFRRERTE
jgi:uncharacterized protein (TIGR03067 family)